MKNFHARYMTDAELTAEVARIKVEIEAGIVSDDEKERDAYFADPANAAEIEEQQARMDLIIAHRIAGLSSTR